MRLDEVLKLRPAEGATVETIDAAIRAAEAKRRELRQLATEAKAVRSNPLAADDRAIASAAREAEAAELGAERIGLLLPQLRQDLDAAYAREARAALLVEHADLERTVAVLGRWRDEEYPRIIELIRAGLAAQDAAVAATQQFLASVQAAYAHSKAMRDGGPLGVTLPGVQEPHPRDAFKGISL